MGHASEQAEIEKDDVRASEELLRVLGPIKRTPTGKPIYSQYQRELLRSRSENRRLAYSAGGKP